MLSAPRIRIALGAILAFGSAIRLLSFVRRPSLWADEATVAVNLASRSLAELAGALYFGQTAPIGFLGIEHLATKVFGVNELALRLWPLLCGLATLWLVVAVSRRFLSPLGTIVIGGAAAMSPGLVRYSTEVKPYGPDAFFAILLTLLTLRALEEPTRTSRWHLLGAVSVVAVVNSFPALLVVAVAGLTLLASARRHRKLVPLIGWGMVAAVVAGSVVRLGRVPAALAYMDAFWASSFPTLSGVTGILGAASRIADGYFGSIPDGGLNLVRRIGLLLVVVAFLPVAGRANRRALLLVGPAVAAILAGLLHFYPMAFRLWLFTVPGLLVLYVLGAEVVGRRLGGDARPSLGSATIAALGALLWVSSALRLPASVRGPGEDPRAAVAWLEERRPPGEAIYVFARALPAWVMYSTEWRRPRDSALVAVLEHAAPGGPLFENRSWPGRMSPVQLASLVRADPNGDEILGVPSGLLRYFLGPIGSPAGDWASGELARIEARAGRCVAVFASHANAPEVEPILAEFRGRGWQQASRFDHPLSPAFRFCRPA